MKRLIFLLFIFIYSRYSFSQNSITTLSQKSNHYLSQDSYHHTWISSADGVNVYDGANVKIYQPGTYNMVGNNIQSHFYEDCNSNMWFSTYNALHVYMREFDDIIPFQFKDSVGATIKTDYKVLAHDNQFVFLRFGPNFGIFDINTNQLVSSFDLDLNKYSQFDFKIFNNQIILACQNGKEVKIFKSEGTPLDSFKVTNTLSSFDVKRVQIINESNIIFNNHNIICNYNLTDNIVTHAIKNEKNIRDFFYRIQKKDFIVLAQDRISCYDNFSLLKWQEEINIKGQLSPLNVINDEIWYNIDGIGLFFFNENKRKFQRYKVKDGPNGVNARGLLQDRKGRLWYTSRSEGAGQFDRNGNLKYAYKKELNNSPTNFILNLIELDDNTILGVGGADIIKYNETTNAFEKLDFKTKHLNHFFGGIHYSKNGQIILEDWNNPKLIFSLSKYNKYFIIDTIKIISSKSFEYYHINCRIGDTIYLAINATELGFSTLQNNALTIHKSYKTNSSFNDAINVGGTLFLAFTDGLYKYKNGQLKKIRPINGSLNQNIYGILSYQDVLYLSTNNGLFSYNIGDSTIHQFTIADGLQELEYNHTGKLLDDKGFIWFAGINGINKFEPDKIKLIDKGVPINISALKINGKDYTKIKNLNGQSNFKFKYFDNTIEFNFNGIDNSDPTNVKLKYKLNKYEKDWNVLKDNNGFARYPNLPPGQYQLQILAANSDGIWNQEPKTITITILPPFWMTWWFILLAGSSVFGIVYYWIKSFYVRKLEKQNLILREQTLIINSQKALQAERTRIASEMHDDLGSGLTRIKYLSDKAISQVKDANEGEEIKKIAAYTNDLIRNMGEIIWAMNTRFDNSENLIAYIRRYAAEYLEEHNIELKIEDYTVGHKMVIG